MKGENWIVLIAGFFFLLSVILLFNQGIKSTGYATSATTTSNVTISTYFAIDMSTNLSDGIRFGNITSLPASFINATHNYDGVNTTVGSYANYSTSMWMNVSTDSNTAVDFCIQANANLKDSGGDLILLGNETYNNATQTNGTLPTLSGDTALTTSYVKAGPNVAAGSNVYYKFWLNITSGVPSGTYNNTVSFEGVTTGGGC